MPTFHQITRSLTCDAPVATQAALEQVTYALLEPVFPVQQGIRLLGVTLSSLWVATLLECRAAEIITLVEGVEVIDQLQPDGASRGYLHIRQCRGAPPPAPRGRGAKGAPVR